MLSFYMPHHRPFKFLTLKRNIDENIEERINHSRLLAIKKFKYLRLNQNYIESRNNISFLIIKEN